jgi:hypothetical protein
MNGSTGTFSFNNQFLKMCLGQTTSVTHQELVEMGTETVKLNWGGDGTGVGVGAQRRYKPVRNNKTVKTEVLKQKF